MDLVGGDRWGVAATGGWCTYKAVTSACAGAGLVVGGLRGQMGADFVWRIPGGILTKYEKNVQNRS